MKLKVVIVDDEEKSRRILQQLVEQYCPGLEVVATSNDVLSAVKAIDQFEPHIVFLDIEMPNYSGFKLVEYFEEIPFKVVFTTAYEEYAFKAFKVSAAGYLLKPIDIDELIKIVDKLVAEIRENDSAISGKSAVPESSETTSPQRFILPTHNGLIYINQDEICYLESQGRYTKVFLVDGTEMTTTNSLKKCQSLLTDTTLLRIHRSYIINLSYLKKYSRGRDSFVLLDNGKRIDVGKNFKEDLSEAVSFFLR